MAIFQVLNHHGTISVVFDLVFISFSLVLFYFFIKTVFKTSQKLEESEAEIRGIFDAAQELFCVVDTNFLIVDYNKRFEMAYNFFYGSALKLGNDYLAIYPAEEKQTIISRLKHSFDGNAIEFERSFRNIDGSELWLKIVYKPIMTSVGKPTRLIISMINITKYKNALNELDLSHSKFESIFDYSTDALFIVDEKGEFIIDCNKTTLRLFEADNKDQIIGLRGQSLHSDPLLPDTVKELRKSIKLNPAIAHEFEYKTFKGNTFWGSLSVRKIEIPDGQINLVRVIDITERKNAEQKINHIERRFRQLADSSPAMLWISDENGKIIFYNKSWLDFRGISLNDEMDWGWKDSIHPDDYNKLIYDIYNPAVLNRTGFTAEYRLKNINNDYKWVYENAVPKFDMHGEFEGLFGSAIDITEIKIAQINLKNQEKFNSRISELSPDHIYIYDLVLKQTIYSNRSLTEFLGYRKEDFNSFNESVFLSLVNPDDYKKVKYNALYFSRFKEKQFIDQEFRMKAPNGVWKWIHTRETIFSTDEKGNPSQILGNARDITEEKLSEQEIIQTNEELKTINEELDSFVYRASHDLRAPLSSVLGLVSLAKMEIKEESSIFYFDLIQRSIQKLSDVTQDLIDHAQNASVGITWVDVDFEVLIKDIIDGLKFHDNASKIKFELNVIGNEPFVSDKLRIVLLFNNLISNAIKYHDMSKDNPFLKVNVNISLQKAEIEVSDNGLGIEEEFQDKIFDMFFRANKSVSGTGLGLYIVKGAIDKLKGTISLTSKPKIGTTFIVDIPNRIG